MSFLLRLFVFSWLHLLLNGFFPQIRREHAAHGLRAERGIVVVYRGHRDRVVVRPVPRPIVRDGALAHDRLPGARFRGRRVERVPDRFRSGQAAELRAWRLTAIAFYNVSSATQSSSASGYP